MASRQKKGRALKNILLCASVLLGCLVIPCLDYSEGPAFFSHKAYHFFLAQALTALSLGLGLTTALIKR